jgi:3-deoxy-D-manno-octulosonic-acid transferase
MRRLYNIVFTVFLLLSTPYYFWKMWRRGNWLANFGQRFGHYSSMVKQAVTNRHILWLHAVSVGEVNICTQLIQVLEMRAPALTMAVSTTTSTGMAELERKLPSHILKIYYPIDRRRWVQRAFSILHPRAVVLVEAEIWPNFLWRARGLRTPVFLVNARLSQRSYRGYRWLGWLFRPLFASLAGVGCQNEEDRQRLIALGCKPEAVRVVGNLKYDSAKLGERRLVDVPFMLRQIGAPADAQLLVGGSTHRGEEAILAQVFRRLRPRFPKLFLVVVPRHHERGKEAGRDVLAQGVKFIYRKDVTPSTQLQPGAVDCLLVNTTGELRFYYEHAAVVFVGKSLTAEGGQNPIEPAMLGRPVLFGPNMQNFTAVAGAMLAGQGACQVQDAAALEEAVARLLNDPKLAQEMGQNAERVVKENLGAIDRTVDMILEKLDDRGVYVVPERQPG